VGVYQNRREIMKVRIPVMIMSHCQGSKPEVLMCSVPKLMKLEMIWARTWFACYEWNMIQMQGSYPSRSSGL
jgi:hypothetical protein